MFVYSTIKGKYLKISLLSCFNLILLNFAIQESCESLYRTFGSFIQERFGVDVALLTGEQTVDLAQVKLAKVIFSTPNYWNSLSKKWRQRKAVQEINLYIFDDLQFIQSKLGALYEMIISRSRFIESQLGKTVRYIGLCHSLLYAKDMAEWLNIPNGSIFNFSPDCRPGLLDITISTQDNVDPIQRIAGLSRQIYSKLYEKRSNEAQFVFIPTRKQAQLLAIDLMYLNVANDKKIHLSDVQVKHDSASLITDNSVRELLENGIGFIHEGLSSNEVEVILNVADKACMPIVFPFSMHKNLPLVTASHVILCDIMIYNGHQDKFENLSSTELLDMLSHVKLHSTRSFFSVFCHPSKVEFIETSIYQPLPIESYLSENLHDHLLEEITSRTIETKADAVDYLTWTYLYRRLDKNPNFYGLNGTSMRHLSDFLSEIVENTIQDLENEKMLMVENEFELVPLNLGMISSHYNISHSSIEMFASTITERTKLNGIIEILTNASEFEDLKFNQDEIFHINKLGNKDSSISDKIVILLQCYFTRQHISMDLTTITSSILAIMIKLLPALIDVIASQSWLKPALAAMELSQMLVQGVRIKDSPLLQIPHLNVNDSNKLEALDPPITNVFEFIELDDEIRQMNLQFSVSQWSAIAKFCNSYPTVDFNFELASDHLSRGDSVIVNTVVSRDADSNNSGVVMSGKFPHRKIENWYVVLGDPTSNKLYAIKRIILSTIAKVCLTTINYFDIILMPFPFLFM